MKILVTGCCGFIGTNIVDYYCEQGHEVVGIDNFSREGSIENYTMLRRKHKNFRFIRHDVQHELSEMEVDVIFHMAAQVGVQASIARPRHDMLDNIVGTFNVLELARSMKKKPLVIFASTNKVYGDLEVDRPVTESYPLDFHTPYGVSKGAADQYVLDYDRIYDVPGIVFRQSCIYGDYQLGAEEQGWVAWFLIANQTKQPITIFGDGNQVRDVLHIKDLLTLYDMAVQNRDSVRGKAYNIGGGPENILSLNELVKKAKITTKIKFDDWRPADQKYYVSNISKIKKDLGWRPTIGKDEGIKLLQKYVEKRWPLRLPKLQS